jgi:hypothetical protein
MLMWVAAVFSIFVAVVALLGISVLIALTAVSRFSAQESAFVHWRNILTVPLALYGTYTLAFVTWFSGDRSCDMDISLIGFTLFWVLFPPLWFFFEHFAYSSGAVILSDGRILRDVLKAQKEYAALASKIWAAILACLGALVAISRHG